MTRGANRQAGSTIAAAMSVMLAATGGAWAQTTAATQADPQLHALTPSASCAPGAEVIGVSRVIEIDAANGPRYGRPLPDTLLQDKEVVLTFDDGPIRRYTQPILEALDEECTKATFFVVGRMALSDPATLRATAQRGHTIAAHTWSHKRLDLIGAARAKDEIELGFSAIALALGGPVAPFFRFPYLGESKAMRAHLAGRHIANMAIDVDSRDFLTRNPSVMRRNVMSQLAKLRKGIILFHDIQPSTAAGLSALLKELRTNGYKVVHLVAKTPVATLPEYDAKAEKEARRRKLALTAQPLADRSVVWPVDPGKPAPAKSPAPPSASTEDLPWTKSPPPRDPGLPPPVTPRLKPRIDDELVGHQSTWHLLTSVRPGPNSDAGQNFARNQNFKETLALSKPHPPSHHPLCGGSRVVALWKITDIAPARPTRA